MQAPGCRQQLHQQCVFAYESALEMGAAPKTAGPYRSYPDCLLILYRCTRSSACLRTRVRWRWVRRPRRQGLTVCS